MSAIPDLKLDAGLPANVDAERTILGAILLQNDAWTEVRQAVRPGDFSLDSHRRIVLRMRDLAEADRAIDIVTLAEELGRHKEIEAVGGVSYLASLTEGLPRRPAIEEYLRIVKGKAILRSVMAVCSGTIARAVEQLDSPLQVASDAIAQIEKAAAPAQTNDNAKVESFIVEAFEEINREYRERVSRRIPSGNAWYDIKTGGGYRHGRIALVAARPNVGKTPWGIQSIAYNAARGRKCVFFSLEMERNEVLRYFVPYVVEVPNLVVSNPHMQTPEQNRVVNQAADAIVEWPLEIYDGDMDIDQICYVIDRSTRGGQEVLFVLDHFGLIAGGDRKDTRNRYNEHSSRLRRRMKHTNGALVALCQLRKVNREYADKPPVADDIKETSNLYEDAFSALIIHRGIDAETRRMSRETFLDLCKLRSGGTKGSTKGTFDTRRLCFEAQAEIADDDSEYFA